MKELMNTNQHARMEYADRRRLGIYKNTLRVQWKSKSKVVA